MEVFGDLPLPQAGCCRQELGGRLPVQRRELVGPVGGRRVAMIVLIVLMAIGLALGLGVVTAAVPAGIHCSSAIFFENSLTW